MVTEGQGRSVKEEGHWGRSRCLVWKERLGSMYYNSLLYWLSQNEVTYYEMSPLHVMCLLLLSLSVFSFICGVQVTATLGVPAVGAGGGRRQWQPAVSPALTQVSADCRAPQQGDAPLTTWGCNQAHIRASPGSNLSLVHFTTPKPLFSDSCCERICM